MVEERQGKPRRYLPPWLLRRLTMRTVDGSTVLGGYLFDIPLCRIRLRVARYVFPPIAWPRIPLTIIIRLVKVCRMIRAGKIACV